MTPTSRKSGVGVYYFIEVMIMSNRSLGEYKKNKVKQIGKACKEFRSSIGYTRKQVASELNTTFENILAFEYGRNDSAYMLSWYVERGLRL